MTNQRNASGESLDSPKSQVSNFEKTKKTRRVGCGLGIVLLTIVAYFGFQLFKDARQTSDFVGQIEIFAVESPTVIERLGEPVQVLGKSQVTSAGDMIELRFGVKGSEAEGEIIAVGKKMSVQTPDGKIKTEIIRESMQLVIDGQVIELNPDEELIPEIEIDFGD